MSKQVRVWGKEGKNEIEKLKIVARLSRQKIRKLYLLQIATLLTVEKNGKTLSHSQHKKKLMYDTHSTPTRVAPLSNGWQSFICFHSLKRGTTFGKSNCFRSALEQTWWTVCCVVPEREWILRLTNGNKSGVRFSWIRKCVKCFNGCRTFSPFLNY